MQGIVKLWIDYTGYAMKVLSVDEMRRVEQECARSGISTDILMENAG